MIKLSISLVEEAPKDPYNEYSGKNKRTLIDTDNVEATPKAIAALLRGLADDLDKAAVKTNLPYAINTNDIRFS